MHFSKSAQPHVQAFSLHLHTEPRTMHIESHRVMSVSRWTLVSAAASSGSVRLRAVRAAVAAAMRGMKYPSATLSCSSGGGIEHLWRNRFASGGTEHL